MNTASRVIFSRTFPNHFKLPVWRSLIQTGYATPIQLQQAWQIGQTLQCSLLEALETVVNKSLSAQQIERYRQRERMELKILYGVECFDPTRHCVNFSWIHRCLQQLIPLSLCDHYHLVPLKQDTTNVSQVWIGMVDPSNQEATNSLKYILHQHGLVPWQLLITVEDYYHLLHEILDKVPSSTVSRLSSYPTNHPISSVSESLHPPQLLTTLQVPSKRDTLLPNLEVLETQAIDLSNLLTSIEITKPEVDLCTELQEITGSHPIVSLVNIILYKALKQGVSDVHFEPQETCLQVRFRKDGILEPGWDALPYSSIAAVTSRLKILANLDIAERRVPQDGQIKLKLDDQKVAMRISTLPTAYGEKVVLRMLRNGASNLMLDHLIDDATVLQQFQFMTRSPFGLILVTGPTSSGKSTTLYAAIAERNSPHINICTVEDPIEYTLPGISQVQVIREKGLDFPKVLRALLRQDPDVILVGEIRDQETAKVAIEAALTGHLVLSTLHTNDAPSTIARLQELGIEPFRVASCLTGILSQRLVRRVCPQCRIPYHPTASDLKSLQQFNLSCPEGIIYRAKTLSTEEIQTAYAQGNSVCLTCKGTGYHHRLGVYELMVIDRTIKGLILEGASIDQLRDAARLAGMKTLTEYSLQLVAQGETTLEEVERVVLSSLVETAPIDWGAPPSVLTEPTRLVPDSSVISTPLNHYAHQLLALLQDILNHPDIPMDYRLDWSSQVLDIISQS